MSSGLLNRENASITESLGGTANLGSQVQSPTKPVRLWAAAGAAILALQLYVWIKWVSGPFFTPVPKGPSDPPTLMKVIITVWTTVILAGMPVAIYYFIVRPWRRTCWRSPGR